jgi:hypothetical protein
MHFYMTESRQVRRSPLFTKQPVCIHSLVLVPVRHGAFSKSETVFSRRGSGSIPGLPVGVVNNAIIRSIFEI